KEMGHPLAGRRAIGFGFQPSGWAWDLVLDCSFEEQPTCEARGSLRALYQQLKTNSGRLASSSQKRKRGPVQAPFFIIDAPKPVTESRIGSGHPGKPIFVSCANRCKSVASCRVFMEILWSRLKTQRLDKKVTSKHPRVLQGGYKIPQELATAPTVF